MKCNVIQFKLEKILGTNGLVTIANISIDGKNLIEILKVFEESFARIENNSGIQGLYTSLPADELYLNLIGHSSSYSSVNGKIDILNCGCGTRDCWPFVIRQIETSEEIIWTGFEQVRRGRDHHCFWDYRNFGKLIFDKFNYEEELDKLVRRKNNKN